MMWLTVTNVGSLPEDYGGCVLKDQPWC